MRVTSSHTSLDTTLHSRDFIQGRDPFATSAAFIVPLILLRTNRLWDFAESSTILLLSSNLLSVQRYRYATYV